MGGFVSSPNAIFFSSFFSLSRPLVFLIFLCFPPPPPLLRTFVAAEGVRGQGNSTPSGPLPIHGPVSLQRSGTQVAGI